MVLKLYAHLQSPRGLCVAAVLKEKNVPYELVHIDLAKGEHKSPGFLEKQPFGLVPYINDDGFILYESRAIARYISAKYRDQGTPLIPDPSDLKKTALFEQGMSIEGSNFDPSVSGIVGERMFRPLQGFPTNEERVVSYLETLKAKLQAYDVILEKQKYIASDEFTLADILHLGCGNLLSKVGVDILYDAAATPTVTRWWKDIISRPAWQAVKDGADP